MKTRQRYQQSKPEAPLVLSLEEGDFAAQCLLEKIGFTYLRLTEGITVFTFFLKKNLGPDFNLINVF